MKTIAIAVLLFFTVQAVQAKPGKRQVQVLVTLQEFEKDFNRFDTNLAGLINNNSVPQHMVKNFSYGVAQVRSGEIAFRDEVKTAQTSAAMFATVQPLSRLLRQFDQLKRMIGFLQNTDVKTELNSRLGPVESDLHKITNSFVGTRPEATVENQRKMVGLQPDGFEYYLLIVLEFDRQPFQASVFKK